MVKSILHYLYATPYTPITASDRSGDLLGWSHLRQQLQRDVFPAFTVLTPRRTSAEVLLLYIKILQDAEIKPHLTKQSRQKLLRHLEVLFGLASVSSKDVKSFSDLLDASENNPYRILNIERIREYLREQKNNKFICFNRDNRYLENTSYGIGPHYTASLRRFGLLTNSNELSNPKSPLVPVSDDRSFRPIRTIVVNWFTNNVGVSVKDLKIIHKHVWEEISNKDNESRDQPYANRTNFWKDFVDESETLSSTLFPTLCDYLGVIHKVASAHELKTEIYQAVFGSQKNETVNLQVCLDKCRTFEVVTSLADFLLYCLIVFADTHSKDGAWLSQFISNDNNLSWLHPVVKRLSEARLRAAKLNLSDLQISSNWPEFSDSPDQAAITEVLLSILRHHEKKKGRSMTFINLEESDYDFKLVRTARKQGDLEKSSILLMHLRQHINEGRPLPLPKLIPDHTNGIDFKQLFDPDEILWKDFIEGNFLWQTFGRWFDLIDEGNDERDIEHE